MYSQKRTRRLVQMATMKKRVMLDQMDRAPLVIARRMIMLLRRLMEELQRPKLLKLSI